jgi:hypothetical protein
MTQSCGWLWAQRSLRLAAFDPPFRRAGVCIIAQLLLLDYLYTCATFCFNCAIPLILAPQSLNCAIPLILARFSVLIAR